MIHVKLTKLLFDTMRADLRRPHPFAYERVGFFLARKEQAEDALTIFATSYQSIPDGQYVNDPNVGAKIGADALRGIMQKAYQSRDCILHVHLHEHTGPPRFSKTDRFGYNQMIPSFHNIGGAAVHGGMVFSFDSAIGLIWTSKDSEPLLVNKLYIVGYPLQIQKTGVGGYV